MNAGSITREGDFVVIRLPVEEVQGLRVALEPCPCKASKSTGTLNTRQRLSKALARVLK